MKLYERLSQRNRIDAEQTHKTRTNSANIRTVWFLNNKKKQSIICMVNQGIPTRRYNTNAHKLQNCRHECKARYTRLKCRLIKKKQTNNTEANGTRVRRKCSSLFYE